MAMATTSGDPLAIVNNCLVGSYTSDPLCGSATMHMTARFYVAKLVVRSVGHRVSRLRRRQT